jgi:hypothetical protein
MDKQVQSIIIVGGGTAGWLSAVFLQQVFRAYNLECTITLIESSDIPTVGVGEATLPTLRNTLHACDIDEKDWMVACNATFKMAIKFVNWAKQPFWHPFGSIPALESFSLAEYWLRRKLAGYTQPMAYTCYSILPACDARRAARRPQDPPYDGPVPYAYHLDAGLLATYLRDIGVARGVVHVVDNVLDVGLHAESGFISHLRTTQHGDLHADLFIDCSGFTGLLINQALGEPFVSYQDSLLCDSALALPIPTNDETDNINPYTTSTALSAGWAWHTPLFGRSGNGYVYSSAFQSRDEAEQEFRGYLGAKADGLAARPLKMRVGRTRNAWVKNCIAIGLAGGFVEPLESTGIWFIEAGLSTLFANFPNEDFHPSVLRKYNRIMAAHYEIVRDFIMLHYCTTQREDTSFWRANRYDTAKSSVLQERLALWEAMLPQGDNAEPVGFFEDSSCVCILAGMDRLPRRSSPMIGQIPAAAIDRAFQALRREGDELKASLPDHYQYLVSLRGSGA